MANKFVKESFVIIVGKPSGEIIEFLDSKKYVNEFLVAKKMNLTVNQVRNILYRLADNGLVSSTRKKDKRKGWYTYFWKTEDLKGLEFLKATSLKKAEQINFHIKNRESKNFYICERCSIEFNEENALLYEFACPECGELFSMKDNAKVLNEFKKNLDRLEKKILLIDEEIEKEKSLIDKKRERELKKEATEKAAKKAAQKLARKTTKKETSSKKTAKKKVAKKKIAKKKTAKKKVAKKETSSKKTAKKKIAKKKVAKKK